jgi:ATP-dependent exoDNAse (exonuclease V) beta subunit
VSELVRRVDDLPGEAGVSVPVVNPEQAAAIAEPGVVFVSAGAGTGKTTVLVERVALAVLERGLSLDSILVITYTERAAGELRERIRERLRAAGRRDLARDVDGAWISTIHGFCSRVLRMHPFEAGVDPRFRVLDESQASVLAAEAFTDALASFCAGREPARVGLLAAYGARGLRSMLLGVYGRLRSAGRPLGLAVAHPGELPGRLEELRAACEAAVVGGGSASRAEIEDYLSLTVDEIPERLRQLPDPPAAAGGDVAEVAEAVRTAALEHIAARDRMLLEGLLQAIDAAYTRAKARESAVDFEDLQLLARDLLARDEAVRTELRLRFRSIMVDEFQDTNRLQCELVDILAGSPGDPGGQVPELFFVGDEFQSIYRFRHADVDVFRERRAASEGLLALTTNYRSRPEVLGVVNHLFGPEFGERYAPLEAGRLFPEPLGGPAVELLVTDKASCREAEIAWRDAEARHVARRVRDLVADGQCVPGDVALLFAAGTSAEVYEEALRAEGLPTYRATGRGYFGQQQVVDLLAYMRLLHNRYDDEALLTVLASPLVGVSNDALVLLRRAAGRRPLFCGLEQEPPGSLSERDRRWLSAFRQRYERLARLSAAVGLERLCDRIVGEHDYDLAVLARWDGRRRYANMRKLARLARSYEELRGRDLEGFVRFVRDQQLVGARELEAVSEEEGAESVRLLTIHAAKGLEFPVVVVCDAGRTSAQAQPDEILCLPDGRLGIKVADPASGRRVGVFGYDEVREAERAAEDAESRRLQYVAMTRAIDRLIVAGSLDPSRRDRSRSLIGWILDRLESGLDRELLELPGGEKILLRLDRPSEAPAPPPPELEQLALFEPGDGGDPAAAFELPPLPAVPEPGPERIRRLSYSALALFERCSYRFYVERFVGLRPDAESGRGEGVPGLTPAEVGDAVHVLLETGAGPEAAAAHLEAGGYAHALDEDVERVAALVAAWRESPLAAELAGLAGARSELPFAFEHDGVLLHGRFDFFWREGERAVVVDYKTNRLGESTPDEVVGREYSIQRLVYALAALRAGVEEVEVIFAFLERAEAPVAARLSRADIPALEAELSAAIAAIQEGGFRPTPHELACPGCPALDRVCAGPRLGLGPSGDDGFRAESPADMLPAT